MTPYQRGLKFSARLGLTRIAGVGRGGRDFLGSDF